MTNLNFNTLVRKYFSFLEDYGFKITEESDANIPPQTDGFVQYSTDYTVVMIDSNRGAASVWFYRAKDGKDFYLTPIDLDEYLHTDAKEKAILLSTNPKDHSAVSMLFNQKLLLNKPGWESDGTIQEKLELRLKNYADWLKNNASLCITGNFSNWPNFYEYKILRTRADYLRRGQNEMVLTPVKNADGQYKLIRQPIFKENFEYVEKLKKEFPG